MKKDEEIYSKEELKLFRKIESGKYKALPKKEFEKEKLKLKRIAFNTLKNLEDQRNKKS